MNRIVALIVLVISTLRTAPALADRIDGDWCDGKGGHIFIDGPKIRIPSGKVIAGDYDRHAFRYTGPDGDPQQGIEIFMMQRSEEEMTLYRGRDSNREDGETWRRCNVTS